MLVSELLLVLLLVIAVPVSGRLSAMRVTDGSAKVVTDGTAAKTNDILPAIVVTAQPERQFTVHRPARPVPRDVSAMAFVDWMIDTGASGQWQVGELVDNYSEACLSLGRAPLPVHTFKRDLAAIGLIRGQLDLRRDGKRHRPTFYVIPSRAEFVAQQMIKARLFEKRALCA